MFNPENPNTKKEQPLLTVGQIFELIQPAEFATEEEKAKFLDNVKENQIELTQMFVDALSLLPAYQKDLEILESNVKKLDRPTGESRKILERYGASSVISCISMLKNLINDLKKASKNLDQISDKWLNILKPRLKTINVAIRF